jgi:hypothetical protein
VWLFVGNPEYFFCQTRASAGWPGSTRQLSPACHSPGRFNEIEELAFLEELFELAYAVAAELLIVKIHAIQVVKKCANVSGKPCGRWGLLSGRFTTRSNRVKNVSAAAPSSG